MVLIKSPNGSVTTKPTLAAASTASDVIGKVIEVTTPQIITTTVTIPADRKIQFSGTGKITYSGAGNVIFTSGCIDALTPQMFGAVPDFVPATGAGTNNATAFQNMLTAARQLSGAKITIPPGKYLITNSNARGTAIELGDPTNTATNIIISGYGAERFMGQSSRLLGLYNCTNVIAEGLKIWGYTGGVLGANRAYDHGITIGYGSNNVTLKDITITNCLGDCIYVGGSMTDGSVTGLTSKNITIANCSLKQRIGNGTLSGSGGTKSRWAISLVDIKGANIYDNVIYGGIDIEPNVSGQLVVDVSVHNNKFVKGPVTPQAVIGTDYWFDEVVDNNGTLIQGFVTMTGSDATTHRGNSCKSNTFECGYIQGYNKGFADISGNVISQGNIYVATALNNVVKDNVFNDVIDTTACIILYGSCSHGVFTGNINTNATYSMFGLAPGGGSFDIGYNIFKDNIQNAVGAAAMFTFTPAATDTIIGPVNGKPHILASSGFASTLVPLTLGAAKQDINWLAYPANVYYLGKTGAGSLSSILNVPDGVEITLLFSSVLTVVDYLLGGGNIRCRGAVDYTPVNTNSNITFITRGGVLFEKSRTEA